MNDFNPEGKQENDPAGPDNSSPDNPSPDASEPSREPITGFTFPSRLNYPTFSGYGSAHYQPLAEEPALPRLIPNIGHTLLFFLIAFILMIFTEIAATVLYQLAIHGPQSGPGLNKALKIIATNPIYSIPAQTAAYGLLILLSIPVFEAIWFQSFGKAIHWNFRTAQHRFWRLAAIGLAAGLLIGSLGNFLPMPKSPPIIKDMMSSTSGAWFMLLFGITAAPMTEELAFRGFLLPSLINIFRWFERLGLSNQAVTRYIGIPVSILLTTIPFALLHASQVSDAWGPLLLIATVSVILCIVRLVTKSVAAGAVVHAAYNFVLFAGVLLQTSGFQHLHKLGS